jgi:hypothetical protein
MTITLRDGALTLTIAPERGGEARSLVLGDVEFMYHPPWASAPLPAGPLAEVPWERSWHGGWQLLWPNAGSACTVDGADHSFHGAGSVAHFAVAEHSRRRARLGCVLDGLACERSFELRDGLVRATASIVNRSERTQPLVLVEHLILGGHLAAEGTTIELDGGQLVEQAWDGTPLGAGGEWPWLGDTDYSVLPATTSRFAVVCGLPTGRARIAGAHGTTLDLAFDREAYPHMWLWEERFGATVTPWHGDGECLAVEPSSIPSSDGLAGAIERGEATLLAPGEELTSWIELRPGIAAGAP